MHFESLRALARITDRPGAAVDLAQNVFNDRFIFFDLDVFEHLIGESELLRQLVKNDVVRQGFVERFDDFIAPLKGAV